MEGLPLFRPPGCCCTSSTGFRVNPYTHAYSPRPSLSLSLSLDETFLQRTWLPNSSFLPAAVALRAPP